EAHARYHFGQSSREEDPAADLAADVLRVRQRLDQEPAEPGDLEHGDTDDRQRQPVIAGGSQRVGPMCQGANSSSPTPCRPLRVGEPLATSRIMSKRRWPTASTDSPSRIVPAFRSMSSLIRSNIGVLVATLMQGVGFRPSTLPRPVVKTRTFAPQ